MNVVLLAIRDGNRAKFNIGSNEVALAFAKWVSCQGWHIHMWDTPEAVYLTEHELCWNATLCGQYSEFLERRKVRS